MKKISILPLTFILFFGCNDVSVNDKNSAVAQEVNEVEKLEPPSLNLNKTKEKSKEALKFINKNNFDDSFCILVDMSLHSGVKRMVVWDFNKNEISKTYLVGHGCGEKTWSSDQTKDNPSFSNVDGSHLSSLGKYKLGERGVSEWGIGVKYLMHGLESSNSNALQRFIVFHSWNLMSDNETFPNGSPEGWGCPTISNNAMREIDPMIKNSKKPILFWMYN